MFWKAAINQPPAVFVKTNVCTPSRGSGIPGGVRAPLIVQRACATAIVGVKNRTCTSVMLSLLSLKAKLLEIAPPFFERPYYIVPEDEFATEGYQVIHAALKKRSIYTADEAGKPSSEAR